EALIDHPNVFLEYEASQKVTVRKQKASFGIDEKEDSYILKSSEKDSYGKRNKYFTFPDGSLYNLDIDSLSVTLIEVPHDFQEVYRNILFNELEIPQEQMHLFLNTLENLNHLIPVSLPEKMLGEKIDLNLKIYLILNIEVDKSLTVLIRVKPMFVQNSTKKEEDFATFIPGNGAQRIFGSIDNNRIYVERNQESEVEEANKIVEEATLSEFETSDYSYNITDKFDAIDIFEKLHSISLKEKNIDLAWTNKTKSLCIKNTVSPQAMNITISNKKDWFEIEGTISIEGEERKLTEVLDEINKGRKYLPIGKGGYIKFSDLLRKNLQLLSASTNRNKDTLEATSIALPIINEFLEHVGMANRSKEWNDLTERLDTLTKINPTVPEQLKTTLRDYQVEGYQWMVKMSEWGPGVCLADDMGLGKTIQSLALLLYRLKKNKGPALIIAPTSVGFNWIEECLKFAPELNPIPYREEKRSKLLKKLRNNDILITSYYIATLDKSSLSKVNWGTLILDEAQAIKNSRTQRSKAVKLLKADWTLALTGTPMENNLGELWSLFWVVSPMVLGNWNHFKTNFAEPLLNNPGNETKNNLTKILKPFLLRRTKDEVLKELPSRTENYLYVEPSQAEIKLYNSLKTDAILDIKKLSNADENLNGTKRMKVLAWLTKLRQACCHPKLVLPNTYIASSKMNIFIKTVQELISEGHRTLVFSQFTSYLTLVKQVVEKENISYQYLDGSVPAKEREKRVKAFQAGEGELFLISLRAGGSGLNLTGANYVIHLDPWWNPAVEDQASDRAHRIGQEKPVTIYKLITKGTIEEKILQMHTEKRELTNTILEGTDSASKLPFEEILKIFEINGKNE
ncbi:MAG: DEAD/DEAH box helicase, partial [Nitrospinae bacterium]|nr:DEAD/DEAH box helicase [Nitrospinota bacterium]